MLSSQTWTRLQVATSRSVVLEDVTPAVTEAMADVQGDGLVYLFVPHTTCCLLINSGADGTTLSDIRLYMERAVPVDTPFVHILDGPQDAAAHVRSIMGATDLNVPVIGGRLALNEWQRIYLVEFDGPRPRTILMTTTAFDARS
jgi:secondary thiamine-phosphate synthase enzyme